MTNTAPVDHPNNEKEPLEPMPRLLITTADHKLQVWDFKSEGTCFVSVVSNTSIIQNMHQKTGSLNGRQHEPDPLNCRQHSHYVVVQTLAQYMCKAIAILSISYRMKHDSWQPFRLLVSLCLQQMQICTNKQTLKLLTWPAKHDCASPISHPNTPYMLFYSSAFCESSYLA